MAAHPGDTHWDLLARWRDPGELARAVFAAAVDPDRAPGEQMLFYVLTGHLAQ